MRISAGATEYFSRRAARGVLVPDAQDVEEQTMRLPGNIIFGRGHVAIAGVGFLPLVPPRPPPGTSSCGVSDLQTAERDDTVLMERTQLPLVNFVWLLRSGGRFATCRQEDCLHHGTNAPKGTRTSQRRDFRLVGFYRASFDAGASHDYAMAHGVHEQDIESGSGCCGHSDHPIFPEDELKSC